MSWFHALLPFAAGFFKGAVEEYARHAPPGRVYPPHGYDFRRHSPRSYSRRRSPTW